jgi:glucose dehydrogenase
VALVSLLQGPALGGQQPADQWPTYSHGSNFSPLTQITPDNVSQLTPAWTYHYGGGTHADIGFVGRDYRFEVQPLHIGGVLYFSTPASMTDETLLSSVTALEPETGRVIAGRATRIPMWSAPRSSRTT